MRKIYFLFVPLLFMTATKGIAQNNNILTQGSFEHYEEGRFVGWYFPNTTYFKKIDNPEEQRTPQSTKCVMVYPRERAHFETTETTPVLVAGNRKYEVGIWVRGKKAGCELTLSCMLYKQNKFVGTIDNFCTVKCTTKWEQTIGELTIPADADRCIIRVRISKGSDDFIYIDDMSMVMKNTAPTVPKLSSSDIDITRYQRELDVEWKADNYPKNTQWQVSLNGKPYLTTLDNKCTIKGLKLATVYEVGISAKIGETVTDEVKKKAVTGNLQVTQEASWRVPFLRTIGEDGTCKRTIDLFYTDLADIQADIRYWLDGMEYTPKEDKLTFSSAGEHTLEIIIKEPNGQEWELYYKVNVTEK